MSAPEFLTQTLGTTYQRSMPNQTHASENTKPHVQILSGLLGKPRGPSPPVPAELASPCQAHLFKSRSIKKNFNQDQLSRSMSRSLLRLPSPSENAHVKVNVKVTVWSRQGRCQESTAAIISQECTCERRAHTKHYARTMAIIFFISATPCAKVTR